MSGMASTIISPSFTVSYSSLTTLFPQSLRGTLSSSSTFGRRRISINGTSSSIITIRMSNPSSRTGVICSASSSVLPSALLFDCDGVLVDTEKDGHRISFNDTFAEVSIIIITLSYFTIFFFFLKSKIKWLCTASRKCRGHCAQFCTLRLIV